MESQNDLARAYLLESAQTKVRVAENCLNQITTAANLLSATFHEGGKVFLCGNGGSAADCQHMAAEFVSVLRKDFPRAGLPAIALTTDTSFLTAYVNDFGFENVFAHQVKTLGRAGDVLLAISTSGNSANVLRAVNAAHDSEMRTIALTGNSGELAKLAQVAIAVPSSDTQHIQEAHLAIEHLICELVEHEMFGSKDHQENG